MRKVRPTKLKGTVKKWLTRAWILNRRPRPARSLSAHPNASSIAAQLPTELLRMIFLHCVDNPRFATRSHVSPPNWISITYVCRRWRTVALNFQELWSTITSNLASQWVLASLQRSSHAPIYVDIDVGPAGEDLISKDRFSLRKRRRFSTSSPRLPRRTAEAVLAHASRIHNLQLSGDTSEMILILTSLDAPIPLDSLTIRVQDGYARSNDYNDPALIVPQSFLAGSAPQLRDLHLYSSLHLTFPSWTLRSVANLTVSRSFSATRLLAVLREMPQLEALTISTIQPINILLFNHNTEPIHLDNLNLFVLELGSLPLFTALSDLLLLPKTARRHYKFTLHDDSYFDYVLWDRFSTVLQTTATIASAGFQAMQFRRQPRSSCIRAWTTPVESGLGPPSWPPLDDVFSISIHCTDYGCVYRQHVSYSAFHRLQDLGVALGCDTVETLAVEYGAEPGGSDRPEIPHGCWSTLFGGLPRVHTLRFGEGATDLLVSASCGTDASPTTLKALCLPHLRRVEVTRGTLRLDTLWGWIHYVFAPPAGMDYADVRKHILALLMEPCGGWIDAGCWRCAEHIGGTQYVTESLLMFLLHWRSQGIWVSELELAGCEWDEPETLELLEKLLRMLEPGWDVIVDAVSV